MKRTMTIFLACAVMAMTAEGASSIDLATVGSLANKLYTSDQSFTLGDGQTGPLTTCTVKASSGATLTFDIGEASILNINGTFARIGGTADPGKANFMLGSDSRIVATGTLQLTGFSTGDGLILNYGENSSISAGAVDLSSSNLSLKTTISASAAFYTDLIQNGTASWDLITTNSGFTTDTSTTFALSEISELKNLGLTLNTDLLKDAAQLKENSYGLVLANNKLQLMANTPEPATATLSLLALAALCVRHRRLR